ncbi:MAG: hypothetical protein OHK0039_26590 [Bacteroidia bacterium]
MKRLPALLLPLLLLTACEGFWGKRTSTDFLDVPIYDSRTVAYVPIQPVWEGFAEPVDIIAGYDELIYVADAGTEEIISFDLAGNELGRLGIPGLTAIAQDRRLDLLACGTRDTLINGTLLTLPAIYRIEQNKSGTYGLREARIVRTIVHPFYFKSSTPTAAEAAVRFTGIAPLADNRYYVSRTGPSNAPNQFGGPDDAVLLFTSTDTYLTPVSVSTNLGLFNDYFKQPQSIATFAQPPQSNAVSLSGDFVFASAQPDYLLKVQGIARIETDFGASYEVRNYVRGDTSKADRFLYDPGRFTRPADITVAGDGTNYIFVVDAARDSLYQFNGLGYEGVNAPAGSRSSKVVRASFGGTGEGLTQFRNPSGVAYLYEIVYVADAGNGRVLRFQLTTDFD